MRGELGVASCQETAPTMLDEFRDTRVSHGDDRKSCRACFQRGDPERLSNSRQHEHVALREYLADALARTISQHIDALLKPGSSDRPLESGALWAVSDNTELNG